MTVESRILHYLKSQEKPVWLADVVNALGGSDEVRLKIREMVLFGTLNIGRDLELWRTNGHQRKSTS